MSKRIKKDIQLFEPALVKRIDQTVLREIEPTAHDEKSSDVLRGDRNVNHVIRIRYIHLPIPIRVRRFTILLFSWYC